MARGEFLPPVDLIVVSCRGQGALTREVGVGVGGQTENAGPGRSAASWRGGRSEDVCPGQSATVYLSACAPLQGDGSP